MGALVVYDFLTGINSLFGIFGSIVSDIRGGKAEKIHQNILLRLVNSTMDYA